MWRAHQNHGAVTWWDPSYAAREARCQFELAGRDGTQRAITSLAYSRQRETRPRLGAERAVCTYGATGKEKAAPEGAALERQAIELNT